MFRQQHPQDRELRLHTVPHGGDDIEEVIQAVEGKPRAALHRHNHPITRRSDVGSACGWQGVDESRRGHAKDLKVTEGQHRIQDGPSISIRSAVLSESRSFKEVSVGAGPFEEEHVCVHSVNQEPVGLDVAFPVMVPVAGEGMVPVGVEKGFTSLQEIDDRLDLAEVLAAPGGEAHVALEPVGGLDEEQELDAHRVAEMTETLVGRERIRLVGFRKRGSGCRVRHRERKGDALVQADLGVKETDRFCFAQAEAVEYLEGLLLEGRVNACRNPVGHGHGWLLYVMCIMYDN